MGWNLERKRFVAALALFLVWVAILTALAIVSAYRPLARSALPDQASPSVEPASGPAGK